MNSLLQKVISQTAKSLFIDEEILQHWIDHQKGIPSEIIFSFFHLAQKYQLDPFTDEVTFFKNTDDRYQVYITINGWAKIMEAHPEFAGISLRESQELREDLPIWMECSIYRNDRILPIVIKEYLVEVKTDHSLWQQMPRRMLRHRVIQQCARLAFGIGEPEQLFITKEPINEAIGNNNIDSSILSRSELLKEKLSQPRN